jgi:signal transduction histidine kinase
MSALFAQIGSLLTAPPGNLIYQLVLAFSVAGALQAAFLRWRASGAPQDRRAALGLGVMLAALAGYFLLGITVAVLFPAAQLILPPLDRALSLILLIWPIWIWVFPERSRQPDLGVLIVTGLAVVAAALSVVLGRSPATGGGFNQSLSNVLWQLVTVVVLVLGAALLYIRRTDGFPIGMAFVFIALVGHIVHLIVREAGDYSGIVRLAHMAAFPLLLTLSQRGAAQSTQTSRVEAGPELPAAEPKRYGADAKTLHALLGLAGETDPTKLHQAIARAVAHTMLADLAFIFLPGEDPGQLDIASGYDLIREDYLQGTRLDATLVPRLSNAIQRGRPLRLQAGGTADDLRNLAKLLGLKDPGDLLSAPIVTAENEGLGALVLLSPYSHRRWNTDDQNLLVSAAGALAPRLQRGGGSPLLVKEIEELADALRNKDDELLRLQRRSEDLAQQLETLALESETNFSQPTEAATLLAARDAADARIVDLEAQLLSSQRAPAPPDEHLQEQLNATLRDMALLQNQLALSEQKIQDLESSTGAEKRKKEQAEVIASISQELRQPMSSIVGYTDLLLGESVGILGALQRKFIERIKASTDRIGGLINDMIQLSTLEVGLTDLKPEAMDLNVIIDNALAYTSGQVREKKISIHLDLPRAVAPVNADREALQQILIHLLQNAGAATPMEGTIALKVQNTVDEGRPFILIQVTDTGGGIPEEDLPRVFTRLFRADNVLIQGVGDTGVGLSIAKTLTEAQHGRIWVESQPGSGATFCVLLPAVADLVGRMPGKETR